MICKTKCVVLNSRKFSESSKILNVYSIDYGRLTLMAKGAFSAKSKFLGVLEILNVIEINFYFKQNREMHTLSSADNDLKFKNLKSDLEKSTCGLICCELINKTQNIGEINPELFNILIDAFTKIDNGLPFYATLSFLYKLTSNLGYAMSMDLSDENNFYFNLNNGSLNSKAGIKLSQQEKNIFEYIFTDSTLNEDIKKEEFIKIYNPLIRYLKIHLDKNIIINSIELLN